MKKETVTIHDIARILNVSGSTVSRALRDHPGISQKTKKAVVAAAQQLTLPSTHRGSAVRIKRTHIIGIIVPNTERAFFASVVRGIEEITRTSGYSVRICQTYECYQNELNHVHTLLDAHVDGIIVSHARETLQFDHFLKVKERGIPLIFFDRTRDDLEINQVVSDDYYGAYKATEHLIQQGCRRIAHLTSTHMISIYKERMRGYRDALTDHSLSYHDAYVTESSLQLEDGRQSMMKLLSLCEPPDAVFAASAPAALGALQICKEMDINVPDKVAIVGFNNEPDTSFSEPGITIIDQRGEQIGNAAGRIFLRLASGDDDYIQRKVILKPELIIRGSSLQKKRSTMRNRS